MGNITDEDYQAYEEDLEILVDTLRQCFNAGKARYHIVEHKDTLFIEIEGLEELTEEEISEVAQPVFDELDMDFDEINLLPMKN